MVGGLLTWSGTDLLLQARSVWLCVTSWAGMQSDTATNFSYCFIQGPARRCWLGRRLRSAARPSWPSHHRPSPRSGGPTASCRRHALALVTVDGGFLQHDAGRDDALQLPDGLNTRLRSWSPAAHSEFQLHSACTLLGIAGWATGCGTRGRCSAWRPSSAPASSSSTRWTRCWVRTDVLALTRACCLQSRQQRVCWHCAGCSLAAQ